LWKVENQREEGMPVGEVVCKKFDRIGRTLSQNPQDKPSSCFSNCPFMAALSIDGPNKEFLSLLGAGVLIPAAQMFEATSFNERQKEKPTFMISIFSLFNTPPHPQGLCCCSSYHSLF
jgi:hypothetical protein